MLKERYFVKEGESGGGILAGKTFEYWLGNKSFDKKSAIDLIQQNIDKIKSSSNVVISSIKVDKNKIKIRGRNIHDYLGNSDVRFYTYFRLEKIIEEELCCEDFNLNIKDNK